MKELVIFDVDETIISGQSQRLFLNFLFKNKYIPLWYYLKISFWFIMYKLGLAKDPHKIMSYAYGFTKNKNESDIEALAQKFFDSVLKKNIYPEAESIIKDHLIHGRSVILVSNSTDILIKKLAIHLNVSDFLSSKLEVKNGVYTGQLTGLMYGKNKIDSVKRYIQDTGLSLTNSWSYADHYSDFPLLSETTHPYAVNPCSRLRKAALLKKWPIINFK